MRRTGNRIVACSLVAALALVACNRNPAPFHAVVVQGSDNPAAPFGITAIDYHFHDTHPSIPLTPDRTVMWSNQGLVLHNVTIPGIGFSRDIQPGQGFEIKALGAKLGGPGVYTFYCEYHQSIGMTGVIVIRGPSYIPSVPASLLPPPFTPNVAYPTPAS
jgi:plastocyanin